MGEAAAALGVSITMLRRWETEGRLAAEHTPGGHRRSDLAKLRPEQFRAERDAARKTIDYARVSSDDQKDDLQRQKQVLELYWALQGWTFEVVANLASGMNYRKKGVKKLLAAIIDGDLGRLVITHRDRLLRCGAELETSINQRHARMLSGLAYSKALAMIRSRAARLGVRLVEVNLAYTSVIGDNKFAGRYGVSVYLSAALAIARRGTSLFERVSRQLSVTLGGGVRGTLPHPERIGRRHVWASWAKIARSRKVNHSGHAGSSRRRSSIARPLGPALERSLEQDRIFLDKLINSVSENVMPTAETSTQLLGRRTDQVNTYG